MSLAYLLTPINIAAAAIILNIWTFMLFGIDKLRAEGGAWRIPEGSLLFCALIGGTAGAYAGRALFRHKTRKQPFSRDLHGIAILQLFGGAMAAGWMLG
jgi:uncharacterized membrane protein YsdA (DUF1294 family)